MKEYDAAWVRSRFVYDPETGKMHWRESRGPRAPAGAEAGYVNHYGYRLVRADGKMHTVHRLIWLWVHGEYPKNQIDHSDGDRLNNRISNLRDVLPAENSKNAKVSTRCLSGIPGVRWDRRLEAWEVTVHSNTSRVRLGLFSTLLDAAATRKAAERVYGYHENHGRLGAQENADVGA